MINAAFAMTTAIGAASGPGAAILLDMVPEFQFTLPILGVQTFNGMTGPGFVMALLWFIYLIAIVISFKEPKRSGLDELRQREAAEASHSEPLQPNALSSVPSADDDDGSIGSCSMASHLEENEVSKHSPMYCIKHMTRATVLCMSLIFMKRIALEVRHFKMTRTHSSFCYSAQNASIPLVSQFCRSLSPIRQEHCWINFCSYQK